MDRFIARVNQLSIAAIVAAVVLAVIVVVLAMLGVAGAETFLVFGDALEAVGITSPTAIAGLFALLVVGVLAVGTYLGYQRYITP